jgi:hypothetical protein
MNNFAAQARRATVGTSVLGWVALVCLLLNAAFWATLMLDLLAPRAVFSPQSLQAALSTAAFALILPLFWSMLLPSSPAGRLLQKQTWHLPGQLAVTFGAVFLTWLAGTWLRAWWQAQPNVVEANSDLLLTVSSLIAGVLVPALSWCVMTPEQWIAQLEQARNVKRIEHAMKMEEAAMRASYARAVALLNADLTSLTIEQRKELGGILGAFARTQQTAMRQIAATWKDLYGVEQMLCQTPDKQLLGQYQQVTQLLTDGAEAFGEAADYAIDVTPRDTATPRQTASERQMSPATTHDTVGQDRTVSDTWRDDDTLMLARQKLSPGWTSKELAALIRRDQRTAQRKIARWVECGWAKEYEDGRYDWDIME